MINMLDILMKTDKQIIEEANKKFKSCTNRQLEEFFNEWEDYSDSYEFEKMNQFEYNDNFENFKVFYFYTKDIYGI